MFTDLAFQFLIDCHYLFFSEINHNYENTTIRDAVKLDILEWIMLEYLKPRR